MILPKTGTIIGADLNSNKLAFFAIRNGEKTVAIALLGTPWTPQSAEKAYVAASAFCRGLGLRSTDPRPLAFVEAAVVAGRMNLQSTIKQAYVSGGVQAALGEWGFTIALVAPGTWKKGCGAGGGANKRKVSKHIRIAWPGAHKLCAGDQDLLDACGLAMHGVNEAHYSHMMKRRSS